MKKLMIGLMAGIFMFGSCASIPKKSLTTADLTNLKGRWEGTREIILDRTPVQSYMEMEIFNDSLPLRGEVKVEMIYEKKMAVYPFENGIINDQSNLSIPLAEDLSLDLSYHPTEGKNRLQGDYLTKRTHGVVILDKK